MKAGACLCYEKNIYRRRIAFSGVVNVGSWPMDGCAMDQSNGSRRGADDDRGDAPNNRYNTEYKKWD